MGTLLLARCESQSTCLSGVSSPRPDTCQPRSIRNRSETGGNSRPNGVPPRHPPPAADRPNVPWYALPSPAAGLVHQSRLGPRCASAWVAQFLISLGDSVSATDQPEQPGAEQSSTERNHPDAPAGATAPEGVSTGPVADPETDVTAPAASGSVG